VIYPLYDIVQFVLLPLIIPYQIYRSLRRGKGLKGFGERFGSVQTGSSSEPDGCETIWVHAVSVGETIAAKPLLVELKKLYPRKRIILSTVTETGRAVSEKIEEIDSRIYFPFDFSPFVKRAFNAVRPSIVIIVETEIWPNFLRHARQRGIPVVLTNGRISDRSFGGYLKLRWFFRPVLANIAAFCMQTSEDARRIALIGADPDRVNVTGNLKYDIPVDLPSKERKRTLRVNYRVPEGAFVITAGSTHAGEEEALLSAYKRLLSTGRESLLVLAPRHPERAGDVAEIVRKFDMKSTLRSGIVGRMEDFSPGEVLVVDNVGELMGLYAISDMVFVGGSLVPTGGHNILEPASLGAPVLFGPHMSNFRESASRILSFGGALQVHDGNELASKLQFLMDDGEKRREMGRNGMRFVMENSGAAKKQTEVIGRLLGSKG
jgi:3-deoxy-D-manno-octulosonic-acid transferase